MSFRPQVVFGIPNILVRSVPLDENSQLTPDPHETLDSRVCGRFPVKTFVRKIFFSPESGRHEKKTYLYFFEYIRWFPDRFGRDDTGHLLDVYGHVLVRSPVYQGTRYLVV